MQDEQKPLAVITGGSNGIGFELARILAQEGHDLVIGGQDRSRLDRAAETLRREGAQVVAVGADLTRPEEVERFYRDATAAGRPIDIFCANAGVGVGGGDFSETDLDSELRLIDLNVRSQVHLTKLVLREMATRGTGRILITASIASMMPGPFESVYSASKAFLHSFSEALRNEWADRGIVVTAFMPGPTDTDFFRRAGMEDTPAGQAKKDDPAQVARQAFRALMANRHHAFTGSVKTRTQGIMTNLMPSPMLASVHRRLTEPDDRAPRSTRPGAALMAGGAAALATVGAAVGVAAAMGRRQRRREVETEDR